MANFSSDNQAPAHPAIMAALALCNEDTVPAYGQDRWTQALSERMGSVFQSRVQVALVSSGTAANALALSLYTPSHGAIFCHQHAHIISDEYGAPGFFSGGAQMTPLAGPNGKITPDILARALKVAAEKLVKPSMLSLSMATESGTSYSAAELMVLCDMAHAAQMGVHVDGARFANVVASLGGPAMLPRCGVDVLSFGGSKNGCINAEAVVVFDPAPGVAERLALKCKQSGHSTAKMRFQAAQFLAYLNGDLWLELAGHANGMATLLSGWLQKSAGIAPMHPVQANMVFYALTPEVAQGLRAAGHEFMYWHDGSYRFVCSYATTAADVMALADHMAGAMQKAA